MKAKKYKVQFTQRGKDDMRGMKEYILRTFQYRELGQNFTKKMKKAVDESGATVTVLRVLQDGMNWQSIMKQWLKSN